MLSTLSTALFVGACRRQPAQTDAGEELPIDLGSRLPTGVHLDPAKPLAEIGPMALTMRVAPERDRVVV